MTIEKWHPLRDLEQMRHEMDRIWEDLFPGARRPFEAPLRRLTGDRSVATPSIDIIDREKEVVVKADMPGVAKEDLDITLREDVLTISGAVKAETETKEDHYYYSERSYASYSRSVNIPFKVEADKIKASLKDGVLTIHLPKVKELQPKKIKVEVE